MSDPRDRSDGFCVVYDSHTKGKRRLRFEPTSDGHWRMIDEEWTYGRWRYVGEEIIDSVEIDHVGSQPRAAEVNAGP